MLLPAICISPVIAGQSALKGQLLMGYTITFHRGRQIISIQCARESCCFGVQSAQNLVSVRGGD